jgi:CO/xanthine dehydrogenase FAD-binding subunit
MNTDRRKSGETATVYSPKTVSEAHAILADRRESAVVIAGGTDLMVLMNARMLDAREFVNIWALSELRGIEEDGDYLRIGALNTYTQLIKSSLIREYVPSLVEASRTIGALQIQNRGTIGGNIVNASPAGDSLPVVAAYDAEVEVGSARGTRRIPFTQFYTGYRKTVLEPDELVLGVRLAKLKQGERDFFWKVGTRRAQAISKTVMAVKARVSGRQIESIAIGVGSVAPTVIRARETELLLSGEGMTPELIREAKETISREISPITDLRSTERYRRVVTANVLGKFLKEISVIG